MPETEQQDRSLSELVVKEAVERGLESPMRETILETVDETDGTASDRRLPVVGAVFGLGAALGFLAGQRSSELEPPSLEDIQEPEPIEPIEPETDESADEVAEDEPAKEDSSGSLVRRLLVVLGIVAAAVFLRRQLSGDDEDEWEPIEEFEPATSVGDDETDEEPVDAEEDAEETEEE